MPLLTDLSAVHALLNQEREWAAYAIGDLAPAYAPACEWRTTTDSSALILVYHGFTPPICFAMGSANGLRRLLSEVSAPMLSLHVRAEGLDAITSLYEVRQPHRIVRMVLRPAALGAAQTHGVQAIGPEHLSAVTRLYAEGHARGEGPTFFYHDMLRQGTFRGIWEGEDLVAIAGTHLYSRDLGVCAIGNIYTRSDRRGRGLGAQVTTAVVETARSDRIPTIVLNVAQSNATAQRVYTRLGFTAYCDFFEGEAKRRR